MDLNNKKHQLGLFSLVMIAIVSVDSLRNLPIAAQYGFSLITFYLIAGIGFFLPVAWVAGKLAIEYPTTGGSYLWIEAAFGKTFGNLSIWLQWIYNMIWYPTIFAFVNGTLGSLISPSLEENKWFILLTGLLFYWLITFVHLQGIRMTRWISAFGSIIGTLLPMTLIIILAIFWLSSGKPSSTPFTLQAFLPNQSSLNNLAFFSNILFSLLGLELIAMHAGNVVNPQQNYPRALWLSFFIILVTLVASSISLCIIMPAEKIGLVTGLVNVFELFFNTFHFSYGATLIGLCIVIGGLAIASSWMIALTRGLQVAISETKAPGWLRQLNHNGMPAGILIFQAVIYTLLLSAFLVFPNINQSYWILSAFTAQFALLYYILLFCAAIKLLLKKGEASRFLTIFLPVLGVLLCVIGIVVGFLPPEQMHHEPIKYFLMMLIGFVVIGLLPVLLLKRWS